MQKLRVLVGAMIPWNEWYIGSFHQAFGLGFKPHGGDGRRRGTDKHQTRIHARLGKFVVFTQKPVAWVNRLCACLFGSLQNALPTQVAVFGRRAAYINGFITYGYVLGKAVSLRVYRNGTHAQFFGGGCHAASNLTPIGY